MKIAVLGLSGSGKTSIYSTMFAEKLPSETKTLAPTIMYEVRRHPYLGIEVSLFDFGGQKQYRKEYLSKPQVLLGSDVVIFVVDLHDPDMIENAGQYFKRILQIFKDHAETPIIQVFYHKYDTEDYPRELLDSNLQKAKNILEGIFKGWNTIYQVTSIYDQIPLTKILRDILMLSYPRLKTHVENAEKQLSEIDTRIIISDVAGQVIVHNVPGISKGLRLRGDLREFIASCNTLRETFFEQDSAVFRGQGKEKGKDLELHLFKYVLSVLLMQRGEWTQETVKRIKSLLADMSVFADLVVEAHKKT
ncbi:MAG: ADP-ribosylation factor-like protein [Candidatus Hodarchaeota archaeon]